MSETHLCEPWIIFAYTAFQLGPPALRPAMTDALYCAFLKTSPVLGFYWMLKLISVQRELDLLSSCLMLSDIVGSNYVSI